jgi:hypothetical protein
MTCCHRPRSCPYPRALGFGWRGARLKPGKKCVDEFLVRDNSESVSSATNGVTHAFDEFRFRLIAQVITLGHDHNSFAFGNPGRPFLDVFDARGDTGAEERRHQ